VGASADALRRIPSVERIAQAVRTQGVAVPDRLITSAVRVELALVRARLQAGGDAPDLAAIAGAAAARALALLQDAPRPVVNATGVIVHTNLGRAPLSDRAVAAVAAAAQGYSDLEYDLGEGRRGHRASHLAGILREITGAEAALVVNNNAAAVLLALEACARGREVLVSRGEAIEIGGGFRIPEILAASGAILRDVGTTNRTRVEDYAAALSERTAAILHVHRSNFAQVGFAESPPLQGLSALAREHGLLLIHDLGSGSLIDTTAFGLAREPLVQESLAAGASIVTFSGDKLLGGPQAGVLVGARAVIDPLARRPLARAVRPDKMTIAALRATLGHYVRDEARTHIPVWQMIGASPDAIRRRALDLAEGIANCAVLPSQAAVGGGSLPGQTLPSYAIQLGPAYGQAADVVARLRRMSVPVIARVQENAVWLDLRTVLPRDEPALRAALTGLAPRLPPVPTGAASRQRQAGVGRRGGGEGSCGK